MKDILTRRSRDRTINPPQGTLIAIFRGERFLYIDKDYQTFFKLKGDHYERTDSPGTEEDPGGAAL